MRYGLYFKLFDRRVYAICIYVYPRICIRIHIRYKVMFRTAGAVEMRECVMVTPAARKSFVSKKKRGQEREREEKRREKEKKPFIFTTRPRRSNKISLTAEKTNHSEFDLYILSGYANTPIRARRA